DVSFATGTTDIHGTYNVSGSTTVASGGPYTFHADVTVLNVGDTLTISNGTVDFSSGETIAVTFHNQAAGVLTGSDDVTVSDLVTWTGGDIDGTGTMFANGDMDFSGGIKDLLRDLEVTGTTTWTNGLFRIVDSVFTNLGLFDVQTDADITFYTTAGTFDNQGTFRKSAGVDITTVSALFVNNGGTVEVLSGILQKTTSDYVQTGGLTTVQTELEVTNAVLDLQDGTLNGTGLVDTDTVIGGTAAPGLSAGELTVEGTYTQSGVGANNGTFFVELGGLIPIIEHDVLTVLGDAQLGGTLQVGFIDGFVAQLDDEFTILTTTGTTSGTFEVVDCSSWEVIIGGGEVTIRSIESELVGDLNCDGIVGITDFLILLAAWGPCPVPPEPCTADLDGDNTVGVIDFLLLLANWTS
ncbi:MAG: hypothetical protein ACYSU7_13480, partial [Planctomycetota bacterium]